MKILFFISACFFMISCATTGQVDDAVSSSHESLSQQIQSLKDSQQINTNTVKEQRSEIQALKAKVEELTLQVKDLAYKLTQPRLISHDNLPVSEMAEPVVTPTETPDESQGEH